MSQYQKFLKFYLSTVFGISLIVSLINWIIDPFVFFGRNTLGAYALTEREFKKSKVNSYSHNALLLGSSKTTYINPKHLKKYNFFNASFSNALPEEILHYLQTYLKNNNHQNLEMVIIGLDLQTLNQEMNPLITLEDETVRDYIENLLSINVFHQSLNTVLKSQKGNFSDLIILEHGQRNPIQKDLKDSKLETYDYGYSMEVMKNTISSFKLPKERLQILEQIKQLLDSNSVNYVVFFNPINSTIMNRFEKSPNYSEFLKTQKKLDEIFPNFVDLSDSQYSDPKYFYKHDVIHYKPLTGKLFLNEILDNQEF